MVIHCVRACVYLFCMRACVCVCVSLLFIKCGYMATEQQTASREKHLFRVVHYQTRVFAVAKYF